MENTLVKEIPTEIKERNAAIVESEFDLDIRVFTLEDNEGGKQPQAVFTVWSCSCVTCNGALSTCWTCVCG